MSGPLPDIAALHWQGAAEGELRLPHCTSCGHLWYPPSRYCPRCLSSQIEWRKVSGRGSVLGCCVFHRAYFRNLALPLPYSVLQVQLDEGPQLYANPVDLQSVLKVGDTVEAVFVPVGDAQSLVRFRKAERET